MELVRTTVVQSTMEPPPACLKSCSASTPFSTM
eukprot:COSAG04_NODE_1381_length_6993_cov_41.974471_7_plen_33_part_00